MTGGDPNGWRRTYVEESSRKPEPGAVGVVGRFVLAFLVGFSVMATIAEVLVR